MIAILYLWASTSSC